MTRPEVSVVIPAFNAESTLGEQLAALADQQVAFPWEVLVCDNGSTDRTAALVRDWQLRLPQLRLVDASARRGPAAARNTGVRHATAPLIAFCDADDVVGAGWLAGMRAALQNADFVAGDVDGTHLDRDGRSGLSWAVTGTYVKSFLPHLPAAGSGNMGIRMSVFEEVGGFEETMPTNEDTDLSWRVQLAGYPLVHHPEVLLHVRKRDSLRAVFRQAYASARGDRQLRYRYAHVISAYATHAGAPALRTTIERPHRWRRIVAKGRSVRRLSDLSDQVWRIGFLLGDRFGKIDRSLPQISPRSSS